MRVIIEEAKRAQRCEVASIPPFTRCAPTASVRGVYFAEGAKQ